MAVGNPVQVGTNTSQVSTHTSIAAAGCVIPANSMVVAFVFNANGTTSATDATAVSDGTHSYTKIISGNRTNTVDVSTWYFYDAAGGTKTITATIPTSNISWIYVFTISGADSGAPDASGTAQAGTTAISVPTAGNVSQADAVALMCCAEGVSGTMATWPEATWTSLVNAATNATRGKTLSIEYKNGLTAGAVATATGTWTTSSAWVGCIVVIKGVVAVVANTRAMPRTAVATFRNAVR